MDDSNAASNMAGGQGDLELQLRIARQTIQRMQRERDALIQALELRNRELQNTNSWLRGELSHAARTSIARVQEEVDRTSAAVAPERRLKAVVDEQNKAIQKHVQDKEVTTKRIEELEQRLADAVAIPIPNNPTPTTNSARPPKRRRQESQDSGQRVSQVDRQRVSSTIVFNNNRREVPGLSLVEDGNVTEKVIEKLRSVMEKPNGKKNMELFLEYIKPGVYYCIHEVASKGRNVSRPLAPSQSCRGCASTFRVKKVRTESGVKLQVGHLTMEV